MNKFIIAIDFDETIAYLTEDLIPKKLLPNAKEVINWCYDKGCYIIIWTCRYGRQQIHSMVSFLKENEIKFHRINRNAPWVNFTDSPKIYYDILIDDKCLYLINWLNIKEKIKIKLIERLALEIFKLYTAKTV